MSYDDFEPDDEPMEEEIESSTAQSKDQCVPHIETEAAADICEEPGTEKIQYWVRDGFVQEMPRENYLIVGFDTEYQPLHEYVDAATIKAGNAKYEPLSYQFYAIHPDGTTWSGIAIPDEGTRLSLSQFIAFVVGKGAAVCKWIPQTIILVGHYNKADVPAFEERKTLLRSLSNVRNSLVSQGTPLRIRLKFSDEDGEKADLAIYLRDTMLLAPAGKKSLAELGTLIGIPKMKLANDDETELAIKKNMKQLRTLDWETFCKYAILDAEISAKYFERVTETYKRETGEKFVPTSLSNIGMKILVNGWGDQATSIVGRETIKEKLYSERQGHFIAKKKHPYLEEVSWHLDFATECYHGGRNEQMWFGPCFEDNWSDYDLKGAYPTAMALIGRPTWDQIRNVTDLAELKLDTLGFACVNFKFPAGTRYPTLPVRSENGIIFPLEGRSCCSSPEIALAQSLGCELRLRHAIIVPQDSENKIFFPFIKEAIARRLSAPTEIEKAFWKEVTNSCYGKTAQGLRLKRVFNLKEKRNDQVPPSKITNPFFSAYITSFVRGVVGEIMNAIPKDKMVFSVTTDGFITNATKQEMESAKCGTLARLYGDSRFALTGKQEVLEDKHEIKQPLGWRTRGQATLKASAGPIVLAKAGLKAPAWAKETNHQNQFIIETFFDRTADSTIEMDWHTSLREMVLYDADLVTKRQNRRFSMEYDFKRRPISAVDAAIMFGNQEKIHLAFDTAPWKSAEDFNRVRKMWDDYWAKYRHCLKTTEDYAEFAGFFDMMEQLGPEFGKYIRKENGALKRLKRDLCSAFKHGKAGLDQHQDLTANQFADLLNDSGMAANGVTTRRADVENGFKKPFVPCATPADETVLKIISQLETKLPGLQRDLIVAIHATTGIALYEATRTLTRFTEQVAFHSRDGPAEVATLQNLPALPDQNYQSTLST